MIMRKFTAWALFVLALASCSAEKPFQGFYSQMYLNEGNRFYNDYDYAKAVEFYTKAIQMEPQGDVRFYSFYFRGFSHYYIGEYAEAIDDLSVIIKMSSDFDIPYVVRGNCYALMKSYEQALADFNKALEINPSNADAYFNKGNVYYSLGFPQRAIEFYSVAVRANPLMDDAYRRRADMMVTLDLLDQALSNYNLAIDYNPMNRLAFEGRSRLLLKTGKKAQAVSDAKSAQDIARAEAKDLWKQALLSLGKGESSNAINLYGKALELDPTGSAGSGTPGDIYYDRGVVYLHDKDYEKALVDFRHAVVLNPKHWKAFSNLGICYYELKYFRKSLDYLGEALKLNPKDDLSYFYSGKAEMELDNTDAAIEGFSSAILFDPNLVNAYLERGNAYLSKGNYRGAILDFNSLIERGWTDPSILLKRGTAFDSLGMFDDAIADYTDYMRNVPKQDSIEGYYLRGNSFMGLKKYALAYRDFVKYVTFATNTAYPGDSRRIDSALDNMNKCYLYLVKRRKI